MNDKELIKRLKNSDTKALDVLVDKYANLIFKIAYSVLNERSLSEECTNDVLLKVWNSIDKFNKSEDKFKSWIIVISKYTAVDLLRKEKKHGQNILLDEELLVENSLVESVLEQKETRDLIIDEINKMDEVNKKICIKRFFLMEPIREIGKALGLSESAINNRLFRERKKLKCALEKEEC
ncbi:sigma-70 family RNA polymerase sigma factor [Clostridium sp. KNHs214]|uniref:sigma-70 family RNA polymerase sigma factor n=1 Tax=Clostridium sp. KNHs214 TaxID=1540257 RepID=UPI00068D7925|nr:sigma-70 family RNA polymerase sigma factor [Clostridium sp. KNHs214]